MFDDGPTIEGGHFCHRWCKRFAAHRGGFPGQGSSLDAHKAKRNGNIWMFFCWMFLGLETTQRTETSIAEHLELLRGLEFQDPPWHWTNPPWEYEVLLVNSGNPPPKKKHKTNISLVQHINPKSSKRPPNGRFFGKEFTWTSTHSSNIRD